MDPRTEPVLPNVEEIAGRAGEPIKPCHRATCRLRAMVLSAISLRSPRLTFN